MENRNTNTRSIIEAGLMSAIVVILMIVTGYVPILSLVGTMLLPIPITVLVVRHTYKVTFTALAVSAVISLMMFNPITAVVSVVTYGSVGLIMGYCILSEKSASTTIILLAIDSLIVSTFNILVTLFLVGKGSLVQSAQYSVELMKQLLTTYKDSLVKAGASAAQLSTVDYYIKSINLNMILTMAIGAALVIAVVSAYVNYGVISAILKRLKIKVEDNIPFSKIYLPNYFVAAMIIILCIGVILASKNFEAGKYIQNSTLYFLGFLFFIDGAAVFMHYALERSKLPKAFIGAIIVITAMIGLHLTYIFIAILDVIFDFRKLDPIRIRRK